MEDTYHYIITKFNIPKLGINFGSKREEDKNGNAIDEIWLEDRFQLFDKYCFPSLLYQTCHNYKWLLGFDINIPSSYKSRIENYKIKLPNIYPIFVTDFDDFRKKTYQFIHNEIKLNNLIKSSSILITSRLDNDDALCNNYIEEIQKQAFLNIGKIIDFPLGYRYSVEKGICSKYRMEGTHFLSKVDRINEFKDLEINSLKHTEVKYLNNFIKLKQKQPMHIEFIHKRNFINRFKMDIPVLKINNSSLELPISLKNTFISLLRINYFKRIKVMILSYLFK